MSKIEFIIPTYNRPNHLMCLLNSIVVQTSDMWSVHVIADCPPEGTLDKVIKYFEGDDRIKFTILPERYNDWGHTPRNYGLVNSTEDWVIMTGEDNYYTPFFVEYFLNEVTPNTHFVYCNMVHNWLGNTYPAIVCQPKHGGVDIGNFMVRRCNIQDMRLNVNEIQADGVFVDEYLNKYPDGEIKHVNKFLYTHN